MLAPGFATLEKGEMRPRLFNQPTIAIAPDSFKGTLTALEAAQALATGLQEALPAAQILQWPMADGGEGTLVALQAALGGALETLTVSNAVGEPIQAFIYRCEIQGKSTAILEVAQVVGMTDSTASRSPVTQRTTLGLGQLIRQTLDLGVRHLYIGLGGSSTNDGGVGLLVGLGARVWDTQGQELSPTPDGLALLSAVDFSQIDPRLRDCSITLLSDVNSPLCGATGATHTFGPQKGLRGQAEGDRLDQFLQQFAVLAETAIAQFRPHRQFAAPLHTQPGTGAAGGLGFALQLLGGIHTSGAQFVAEQLQIRQRLKQVDWLITGEGCSDHQTLQGKAPWIVAQMAHNEGVPVTLLSGAIVPGDFLPLTQAFEGSCFSLVPGPACCFSAPDVPAADVPNSAQDCLVNAADWLRKAGLQLGYRWQTHLF